MYKSFFTILVLITFVLSMSAMAGKYEFKRVHKVTAEDEARFEEMMKTANSNFNFPKLSGELGRTWYDYACNNITARTMAYALDSGDGQDGIHFVYMKRQPDAAGNRYVTYDYWDNTIGLFFGNQSITEAQPTGWGRVINGHSDEAIVSFHGGGGHLWQDLGEVNYAFSEKATVAGGLFPGFAVTGDTVFFMANLDGGSYTWIPDTVLVSTDYMSSWTGANIWPPDDGLVTDYGVTEMWPTFNPTVPGELSVVYAPNVTATAPNGAIKMATTNDLGASWTTYEIHNDDTIFPDNSQLIVENFGQLNSMYGMDGTYHVVMGAVQGIKDTLTSTQIDYFPLLYWNTRDQQFIDLAFPDKSYPADTTATLLTNNEPGNALCGLNYPTLSEGPNGELVCLWMEWEDDGTGLPVMATPTGGVEIFCTDIWGAYSVDAGFTWSDPFWVAGTAGESDAFPYITKNFHYNAANDSLVLDIAYMWDTNAGVSLFGDSDASECIWYYEQVVVPVPVTGIENETQVAQTYSLEQNFPNPFNPTTEIRFNISKASDVSLEVFNVLGEKVATLVNGNVQAGDHTAIFEGANFASGVYFYQLTAGDFVQSRKMLLVK